MIESGHDGKIVERAELALLRRQRALARLGLKGALLAPERTGRMLGVFPKGDRRRRPLARLSREDVRALLADGALAPAGFADTYRLTPAGAVRTLREKAEREPWRVQHGDLEERLVMADDGVMRAVWGEPRDGAFARITKVVEKGFFERREIAAAQRLQEDWERGQFGLSAGSDWTAPPFGSAARGAGGAQERALASAIDARRRVERALGGLPVSLASAVRAACLEGSGLADLERARRWPTLSGKRVLKLGLALLADHYGIG
ncbi:MAG: hypothetical protein JNM47_15105 [Hyphomonadaceae bacterium]|nr:hypothetical protein [Hyphomonadaceae bacterium]